MSINLHQLHYLRQWLTESIILNSGGCRPGINGGTWTMVWLKIQPTADGNGKTGGILGWLQNNSFTTLARHMVANKLAKGNEVNRAPKSYLKLCIQKTRNY